MKKIKRVTLYFPNTENCTEITHEVGKKGVTEIKSVWKNDGSQYKCYEIWKGDRLHCDMYTVSEVVYSNE